MTRASPSDTLLPPDTEVRQWGHLLEKKEGSHQARVKKLLSTLKDGRIMTEQPLRLCALQRLTPAAATGHRGALAAQANALLDRQKARVPEAMHWTCTWLRLQGFGVFGKHQPQRS
eukprot:g9401.t1